MRLFVWGCLCEVVWFGLETSKCVGVRFVGLGVASSMGVNSDAPLCVIGWSSIYTCIVWVQRLALLSYFSPDSTMPHR